MIGWCPGICFSCMYFSPCSEPMTFFSGGLPIHHEASSSSITILTGTQALQVLHFESRVIDFACLCEGAYPSGEEVLCSVEAVLVKLLENKFHCIFIVVHVTKTLVKLAFLIFVLLAPSTLQVITCILHCCLVCADVQDPHTLIVLLENSLQVVDLLSQS